MSRTLKLLLVIAVIVVLYKVVFTGGHGEIEYEPEA